MDARKHLIIIKGKDQTDSVASFQFHDGKCEVVYTSAPNKSYSFQRSNVEILPLKKKQDTPYQIIKDVSCFVKSFMCRILSEIIIFRCSISSIKEIFLGIEGSVLFRCQTDIGAVRLLLSCFDIVA